MHDSLGSADRKGVHAIQREVPPRPDARQRAQRHHHRRPAIEQPHRLAEVEVARQQPAVISRQPGMVCGGVGRATYRSMRYASSLGKVCRVTRQREPPRRVSRAWKLSS